jgi:DNA-binding transcriptional MerR regulator
MNEDVVTTPTSGRRLTIGAVCAALRIDHPDISISKIRYLEEQGLLHPQRTRGGYRLFAQEDVERLRTILRLQRDEFLPLRVIRDELEKAAEGARQRPRRRPVSTGAARGPRFGELISAAGVNEEFVRSLEEFGLIAAEAGRFRPEDVQIVAAAARLQRYGFDARHLRAIHSAIQRESGLVEQVLAPQLRSSNPDRVGAGLEQLDELAGLCAELTESLLVRDLRRLAGAQTAQTRSAEVTT